MSRPIGWTVEFTAAMKPVPAPRINSLNIYAPEVQNYLHYKRQLADLIVSRLRKEILSIPPVEDQVGRRRYSQHQRKLGVRYRMTLEIQIHKDRGDLDNYFKGVKDAIQDSGLIFNDKQIKAYGPSEIYVEPHLEEAIRFTLELLPPYIPMAAKEEVK